MAKTVGIKQLEERVAELERKLAAADQPCASCGRCPSCGGGAYVAPYNPWYPYRYIPYYPHPTWWGTTTSGSVSVGSTTTDTVAYNGFPFSFTAQ